ncbi:uncharacterized protein LOC143021824 [Oratosquilla oratoria]|uniref:uncharacterized protein LOC143021824 n=1 Tax=Oratosquilla oratoria TaxID=337810 RepID=UPI003F7651AD
MHQTVTSAVWERRTNKVIAGAVTIIGLTMMISGLEQCIYIGLVFVVSSLGWLAWVTVREKKAEPPRPDQPTPPVLLLVSSQHLMQIREQQRGNISDPDDKPPSYDQILKLDGLPPDYFSLIAEKPPRYEDLRLDYVDCVCGAAAAAPLAPDDTTIELPLVHGLNAIASDSSLASVAVGGAPPTPTPRHFESISPRPDQGHTAVVFSLTLPSDEDPSLPHFADIEDESAAMTQGSKLYEDYEDEEVGARAALTMNKLSSSSSVGK